MNHNDLRVMVFTELFLRFVENEWKVEREKVKLDLRAMKDHGGKKWNGDPMWNHNETALISETGAVGVISETLNKQRLGARARIIGAAGYNEL